MICRPIAASVLIASTVLAFAALADDFRSATIVDAGTQNELVGNGQGGVLTMPQNTVTVLVGTLKITGQYYALAGGSKAASQLIVGDTVQARVDGKWLYFVGPSGKTIKARIVRQERVAQ